jgi:hypothetical protein
MEEEEEELHTVQHMRQLKRKLRSPTPRVPPQSIWGRRRENCGCEGTQRPELVFPPQRRRGRKGDE